MSEVDLPKGWLNTTLESLTTDISYGYTASSTEKNIGPKMLRITDIQDNHVDWKSVPFCEIDESKVDKYLLRINDLVFARTGATVGKSYLIRSEPPPAVYASYLIRVRTASDECISMLAHFFNSSQYWQQITEFSAGIGQPNVNGTKLKNLIVPLPPLAEQKVIADKLDTLLVQVETTKARLERIPEILKSFRQSVLTTAVSGKLTEVWRGGKAKDWLYPQIKEVGSVQLGRQRSPKYHFGKNMKPYLRVQNVFEDFIDTSDVMEMEFSVEDFERYRLNDGDILLNEGQSPKYLGRPAIYRNQIQDACFTNTLIRFQAGPSTTPEFALIVFRNHMHSGRYISEGTITTNIAHLGAGRFGKIEFPLPTKTEQTEIVRRVEQLFACADSIEQKANAALARVNNLTQSILAKAFRGELTADWRNTNPDLITGDNSAEALLAKIKAERAKLAKKTKAKA